MNRVQCHDFTSGCLNDYSKRHDDRVTTLFQTYDEDRDGLLELNDILKFFKLAAREKPAIVWLNLRNFGVNSEFKFMDEVELEKGPDKLPRRILAENQQFYKILFDLLHIENMASISFNILQRLPVPNFFYQKYFPNVS